MDDRTRKHLKSSLWTLWSWFFKTTTLSSIVITTYKPGLGAVSLVLK